MRAKWVLGWVALAGGCAAPEAPPPIPHEIEVTPQVAPTDLAPLPDPGLAALEAAPLAFPFLEGEREDASVSIGDTTHGRLVNARELVVSDAVGILPRQAERDLRFGTDALIGMLEHAGRVLHEKTRTRLWIGNLGRREGGDIIWSVSHNAGRDADVAFCYRDAAGRPVDPPDLVPLGKSGASKDGKLHLDAARTWTALRAMLEYEGASIQYVFVAEPLKQKILQHAKSTREPPAIIERANAILKQPAGAAPHDDHLHVRLFCARADAAGGCIDMGYVHPFAKLASGARAEARELALGLSTDPRAAMRRRALLRLGLVGDAPDAELGVARLGDEDPSVRAAAASLVGALGTEAHVAALTKAFFRESDPRALAAIVDAAGALGGPEAGPFLRDLVLAADASPVVGPLGPAAVDLRRDFGEPKSPLRLLEPPSSDRGGGFDRAAMRLLAVRASGRADRLEPVAAIVPLLDGPDEGLALEAAETLAFATNHRLLAKGDDRPLRDRLDEARRAYDKLLAAMPRAHRDAWVVRGFAVRGYKVPALDRRGAWELLRAVDTDAHLSYNARRSLARALGEPAASVGWHAGEACRHFKRVLHERRAELGLGRPTRAQELACLAPAD